jgi:BASS family bile acid:Na+ symporter
MSSADGSDHALKPIFDASLALLLSMLMFGMGASCEVESFTSLFRSPRTHTPVSHSTPTDTSLNPSLTSSSSHSSSHSHSASPPLSLSPSPSPHRGGGKKAVLLGFTFQYGITPLVSLAIGYLFYIAGEGAYSENDESMEEKMLRALGVILVGVSPGGTTSQLYTAIAKGDVALSIAMTFCSTIAAFGAMPLLLFIYSELLGLTAGVGSTLALSIPFTNILLALLLVVLPVGLGVLLRSKCGKKAGKVAEKIGTACGLLGITIAVVLGIIIWPDIPSSPPRAWAAALLLTPTVCFLSYFLSRLASLSHKASRTVSIEAGVQNSSLTLAVVSLSFSHPQDSFVIAFPLLYSVALLFTSLAVACIYRFLFPLLGLWVEEGEGERERERERGGEGGLKDGRERERERGGDGVSSSSSLPSVDGGRSNRVWLGESGGGGSRRERERERGGGVSRHRSRRGTSTSARSPSPSHLLSSDTPPPPSLTSSLPPPLSPSLSLSPSPSLSLSLSRSSSGRRRRSRRNTSATQSTVKRERKNTL